jgi:hypothetical protein
VWGRVRLLDGYTDEVELELPQVRKRKKRDGKVLPRGAQTCSDMPEWMLDPAEKDAGLGIHTFDTSDKAWSAIKRWFDTLKGCGIAPKVGEHGRFKTLQKVTWEIANLVADGELSKKLAIKAYFKAAKGIYTGDGKYDAVRLKEILHDAFRDVGRI